LRGARPFPALLTFLCLVCTQCPHILLHKMRRKLRNNSRTTTAFVLHTGYSLQTLLNLSCTDGYFYRGRILKLKKYWTQNSTQNFGTGAVSENMNTVSSEISDLRNF